MCKRNRDYVAKRHRLSEIYEKYRSGYLKDPLRKLKIEDRHLEVMRKAEVCRTLKLGAILLRCEDCGTVRFLYHTCKHRFCSDCGAANTYQWAEKTLSRLYEIPHHHIVMTLPKSYRWLSQMNGNKLHDLLFRSSAAVIREYFRERYDCLPGIVSVLHTAGSDLKYHPHIHMIVSRGGKQLDGSGYKAIKGTFLVKNEVLAGRLKAIFHAGLKKLRDRGELEVPKSMEKGQGLNKWLKGQQAKKWIVNIEKPLEEVSQIVNYVGRYTKRACISEYSIESISPEIVFRYKDYKNSKRGEKPAEAIKRMTPTAFLDALLQHVPRKRYRMVRYSGLYNSFYMNRIPEDLRAKVNKTERKNEEIQEEWGEVETMRGYLLSKGYQDLLICRKCKGKMEVLGIINKDGEIYANST